MYDTTKLAEAIKSKAKENSYAMAKLLSNCDLGKDTINTMARRGSWIQADSLAKIADELDCSVDYLLGRTSNPQSHKAGVSIGDVSNVSNSSIGVGNTINAAPLSEQEAANVDNVKRLNVIQEAELLVFASKLEKEGG